MNRSATVLIAVTFYGYSTNIAFAASCNDFRNDIQTIQQQVRQDQVSKSTNGFNAVQTISGTVKTACLDTLSALDMTAFGLTPGAAAVINKAASAACKKLASEASQKVGEITQKVSQGTGLNQNQFGGIDQMPGFNPSSSPNFGPAITPNNQTITNQISNAVGNAWESMKSVFGQ